ncbi:MAG: hypothetical protein KCHDKBKB_02195 [Elusimicrobia bacterium]|nr:hypothetical protein [Elusimicrobiota bacterium]
MQNVTSQIYKNILESYEIHIYIHFMRQVSEINQSTSGTTLVELMVAVAILGIVSIGLVGVFGNLGKATQTSKNRTLAANLAQEKMQILKEQIFDKVLVTTSTAYLYDFDPPIPYDTGYYPPEPILEGGIRFTRYTFVEVTDENSGGLVYLGAVPDSGMKAITVTAVWTQGTEIKKIQINNILGNINMRMNNAIVSGQVTNSATSTGIQGALITMAENVGYQDFSDASGNYLINLLPGTYTMSVTASGYFPSYLTVSVPPTSLTQPISLVAMGSGTVQGTAWINNHLVISQVVGSSISATGFNQEWVEVFNPTTWTWTASGVGLKFQRSTALDLSPVNISINYVSPSIAPGGFYLFANTTTITAAGTVLNADATWNLTAGTNDTAFSPRFNSSDPNIITTYEDTNTWGRGSVQLYNVSDGTPLDTVGWTGDGSQSPPLYEGNAISQFEGLNDNEQFYRYSSTSGYNPAYGPAYDSGDNNTDLSILSSVGWVPKNTASATVPVVAGVPAIGAFVTATDGLSQTVNASSFGSPPCAQFQLTSVATGTWTVYIASSSLYMEISSVTVSPNTTTLVPNANTSPSWPSSGYSSVILSSVATQGYVSGWVKNALGVAISPAITVSAGSLTAQANTSNGTYILPVSPGTYDIMANVLNPNSLYVWQASQSVVVNLGEVTSNVNFNLTQGGKVRGFCTRDGTNALPGIVFTAVDAGGATVDQEVSGTDGIYILQNLSTGTYTISPSLGSGEIASPTNTSVTVIAGTTVNAATFTISGAFGSIAGSVTESGQGIKTGVIIVCSTMTLSSGPPQLSTSTLTSASVYVTNSYEDGTYIVDVRGSTTTTYVLYAYYPKFSGSAPVISSRTVTNVSVTPGYRTSGVNFAF